MFQKKPSKRCVKTGKTLFDPQHTKKEGNIMRNNIQNLKTGFDFIENNENKFYLTGSRFFGLEKYNSDFDFAVQYSEKLYQDLEDYGFRWIITAEYRDKSLVCIFQFGNVQIQLRKDIEHFLRAQNLATKLPRSKIQNLIDYDWDFLFDLTKES